MKHGYDERAALVAALSHLNIPCTEQQQDALLTHLDLLVEKNKHLNLTRITSYEDALILHIEDSLSLFENFSHSDGLFCDLGTGGGFPGLPLAIVSGRHGVLLDSIKKKARAVQGFIDELGMGGQLESLGMRSEELALLKGDVFDTVVVRAVSSLNVIEELSAPLLSFKGRLLAMRGKESSEDEKTALRASEKLGFELVEKKAYQIGGGKYSRSLYVFEKVGEASITLPRRVGMAEKRPLGLS